MRRNRAPMRQAAPDLFATPPWVDDAVAMLRAGDVIHIERNTIHAYVNRGPEPAAALVVYSPAPGPKAARSSSGPRTTKAG